MKPQIELKGSSIAHALIVQFKNFDDFYAWADPIFKGSKKEFEAVYYSVVPKETKGGAK